MSTHGYVWTCIFKRKRKEKHFTRKPTVIKLKKNYEKVYWGTDENQKKTREKYIKKKYENFSVCCLFFLIIWKNHISKHEKIYHE